MDNIQFYQPELNARPAKSTQRPDSRSSPHHNFTRLATESEQDLTHIDNAYSGLEYSFSQSGAIPGEPIPYIPKNHTDLQKTCPLKVL